LQIDELSKELKRTQDQYELIKSKLKLFKNRDSVRVFCLYRNSLNLFTVALLFDHGLKDTCENCSELFEKYNTNSKVIKEKDQLIIELVGFVEKFKNQMNLSNADTMRLASVKHLIDSINSKLNKSSIKADKK
jgi:hypothetical protein